MAYLKLGVAEADVQAQPQITPLLVDALLGGVHEAVGYLRSAGTEEARKFLKSYDELTPTDRDRLSIEAFCLAASVPTKRLLEVIVSACYDHSDAQGKLIASAAHPRVVKATADYALAPDGHQDRKVLLQHKGFLPLPKNQTTIFSGGSQQHNTQNNHINNGIVANQNNISPNEVQSIETKMSRITDRYNQRMGIAPKPELPEAAPMDAELLESSESGELDNEQDWG